MDNRYMVKQYVAVVQGPGCRFQVFETGNSKYYLFSQIAGDFPEPAIATGIQFPVLKSRLRNDVRRALANGYGNSL